MMIVHVGTVINLWSVTVLMKNKQQLWVFSPLSGGICKDMDSDIAWYPYLQQ